MKKKKIVKIDTDRDIEEKRSVKCAKKKKEKLCEEFKVQASVFCESVESQSSVKGETYL